MNKICDDNGWLLVIWGVYLKASAIGRCNSGKEVTYFYSTATAAAMHRLALVFGRYGNWLP